MDTIKHKALWTALAQFGIEPHHISLLKRLYADQKATVLTDKESDVFEIKKGSKQGDPLSRLLFNTVLQAALKDGLERWREKDMGISLGDQQADCLSNLRFADDVTLFSTSLEQLRSMMCDFKKSRESVGLKIHPEKTKILSNQGSNRKKEVKIDNMKERAKYLGQTITFEQQGTTEIKSRSDPLDHYFQSTHRS